MQGSFQIWNPVVGNESVTWCRHHFLLTVFYPVFYYGQIHWKVLWKVHKQNMRTEAGFHLCSAGIKNTCYLLSFNPSNCKVWRQIKRAAHGYERSDKIFWGQDRKSPYLPKHPDWEGYLFFIKALHGSPPIAQGNLPPCGFFRRWSVNHVVWLSDLFWGRGDCKKQLPLQASMQKFWFLF